MMSSSIELRCARRGGIAIASLVAAAMVLTACSGMGEPSQTGTDAGDAPAGGVLSEAEWDELVEAATAEGEVVVYSSLSGVEPTFERFAEAYPGITVRVERAPTAELVTRLDQELAVGAQGGDVALHSLPSWFAGHDTDGSFVPLQVSPENDVTGWAERIDGRNHSEMLATPLLLGVNTDSGEAISSAEDILDTPKDARIAIIEPDITLAQAYQYQLWLDEYGDDFLEKLSERDVSVYSSNVPLGQDIAAGARDYGLGVTPTTILALKDEGAPVDAVVPDEAVAGILYNAAVLSSASHPNAAQLFTNWLASEEGADVIVERHYPVAVPMDAKGSVPWDSMSHPDVSEWTTEYWQEWIAENWDPHFG